MRADNTNHVCIQKRELDFVHGFPIFLVGLNACFDVGARRDVSEVPALMSSLIKPLKTDYSFMTKM